MTGVNDQTQLRITVPDDWGTNVEGKEPGPSPAGGQKPESPADSKGNGTDGKETNKPTPYDKDPKWKKARSAEKQLNTLLGKVGANSVEDLADMIDRSASVLDKLEGVDFDEMLESARELERTKAYMAEEKLKKQEADETFEETIARLKKEKQDLKRGFQSKAEQEREMKDAQKVLKNFTSTVESSIAASEDLPEEYHDFAKLLMGVGNPANEIDISDKRAVKRMAGDLTKVVNEFAQRVIQRYRSGKQDAPPMSSNNETPSSARKPIKSIRDATREVKRLLNVRD
jgi:hypothetical protein